MPDLSKIEMKRVEGFTGYYVTPDGRLFSDRYRGLREIKGSPDKDGYLKITLTTDSGKPVYKRKHRIIAEVFLGSSPLEVNHKDGNRLNNALSNLEYVTLRENQCHRRKSNVGVCWSKKEQKWRAYLQHNKVWYHLGFHDTKEQAKQAYIQKVTELGLSLKYAV